MLKLQCLVYLKRMPSKDWVMREAEHFPFSDKQVQVEAQHLPGSTEQHKGLEGDRETECWCQGCWSGMIRWAARGAKPEEETALGVLECENPNPLCAWLRGPVPCWEAKWRSRFVMVPMGGLCNCTQLHIRSSREQLSHCRDSVRAQAQGQTSGCSRCCNKRVWRSTESHPKVSELKCCRRYQGTEASVVLP